MLLHLGRRDIYTGPIAAALRMCYHEITPVKRFQFCILSERFKGGVPYFLPCERLIFFNALDKLY
jgi:hypothetical protein